MFANLSIEALFDEVVLMYNSVIANETKYIVQQ